MQMKIYCVQVLSVSPQRKLVSSLRTIKACASKVAIGPKELKCKACKKEEEAIPHLFAKTDARQHTFEKVVPP